MPPAIHAVDGLHAWTITLENGDERVALGSSLQTVIGHAPNVVSVVRGAPFTPGPPPVAASLAPATATIGDPDFTLQVLGEGFTPGCQILWNGSPEPTTVVSDTELTTGVNMATAEVAMDIPVAVRGIGGQESNVLTFTLAAPAR